MAFSGGLKQKNTFYQHSRQDHILDVCVITNVATRTHALHVRPNFASPLLSSTHKTHDVDFANY